MPKILRPLFFPDTV